VILRTLGYVDVRNYDGSWFEWSADASRAVSHE
jgi:3-mercaptopyruvate sulfurtransferase SseA